MQYSMYHRRQGHMDNNYAYFYTLSIENMKRLLDDDKLKHIIIESWQYLVGKKLIEIYGYVIMPNHLHLIWNILADNGKESPAGSFAKYTAHQFRRYLLVKNPSLLDSYVSDKRDRKHQFWKRDPLAIPLSTETILLQKLQYIHANPIREKWNLCEMPEEYRWSSARFYHDGYDEFSIVKHFKDA